MLFITILSTSYAITASLRQAQIKSQLAVKETYQEDVNNVNEIVKQLGYTGESLDINSTELRELIKQIAQEEIQSNKLAMYPVGSTYTSVSSTSPADLFGGTWKLESKNVIDTGWQDFSWTNSDYIGTSQSSYTKNQWRVKDNILYIQVGAGSTNAIDTRDEIEISRIPIIGNTSFNDSSTRIWNAAIGWDGTYGGFFVIQKNENILICMKPHKSDDGNVGRWFSTYFAIPLDDTFSFTSGTYETEYKWVRVS